MIQSTHDPRTGNDLPVADNLGDYLSAYSQTVHQALGALPRAPFQAALQLLEKTLQKKGRIFVGGNGGSSAIADHLCCDWMKGIHSPGKPTLKVQSLTANSALFTALANDFGYEKTLSTQIEMLGEEGDVAVLISSSGNSPNIIAAAHAARTKKMPILGFTGFSGGKLKELSDISLHIAINNYGMVEDAHQTLMHVLSQYLGKVRDSASAVAAK